MMKHEFEALAGYEVTTEDYNKIIEPMYMATDLTKEEFVKVIDKKRFALPTKQKLMKQMKAEARHLEEICGRYTDHESEHRLEALAKEYAHRFYGLDWVNDMNAYVFFNKEYEFPEISRGCTYPKEVVIGRAGYANFEVRLNLI